MSSFELLKAFLTSVACFLLIAVIKYGWDWLEKRLEMKRKKQW